MDLIVQDAVTDTLYRVDWSYLLSGWHILFFFVALGLGAWLARATERD